MQIKYPEIIVLNSSDSIVNSPVRKAVLKFFSWEKKKYYRTRDGMKVSNAQEDVFIVNRKIPGTFFVPTGLISNIIERLKDLEIEFKLTDEVNKKIKTKPVGKTDIQGITLRDAQVEILADIAGKPRGVIHAATGVGKSLVSLGIFHQHKTLNPKCKILFIAHTIDLVVQAADQFKDHFSVGVWQGKKRTDGDIICATIQTAKGIGIEKLQKMFSVLVWDECFHENTWVETVNGKKKIKDISVGDMVQTSTGHRVVKHVFKNKVPLERVCRVKLSDGRIIYCSVDHVFKTPSGEIMAKNLTGKEVTTNEKCM